MENEKRTDRNSWAELDENRLSDILTASQIKATDTYETPPQIIWIDNSTIATLGNFSASTGKAKAKKTFNVSAIVAASLAGLDSRAFDCSTLNPVGTEMRELPPRKPGP